MSENTFLEQDIVANFIDMPHMHTHTHTHAHTHTTQHTHTHNTLTTHTHHTYTHTQCQSIYDVTRYCFTWGITRFFPDFSWWENI